MLKLSRTVLLVSLACLSLGGACSSDQDASAAKVDYEVTITQLDGTGLEPDLNLDDGAPLTHADDSATVVNLRCDGTLTVTVAFWPASDFTLRPAYVCGESTRCGYVRIEGLDGDGAPLVSVDTATTQGVLDLRQLGDLSRLKQVRAALMRGIDREPLLGADDLPVQSVRSPTFVAPTECPSTAPDGAGGEAGAGGQAALGGAGGEGGEGGRADTGAGGAGGVAELGGAGAGGALLEAAAGGGGAPAGS